MVLHIMVSYVQYNLIFIAHGICYVMLYIMFCYVMLCYFMLFYVMLCYVMLFYVMSCHVMSCHVMSCHVMSCHVMSCHVMSLSRKLYYTSACCFILENLIYILEFSKCLFSDDFHSRIRFASAENYSAI